MKAIIRTLFAGVLLALGAYGARAQQPMSDPALGAERGGYLTAAGVSFDFGAVVSTFVDNKLALETRFSLSDAGAVTTQMAQGAGMPATSGTPASLMSLSLPGDGGATQVLQKVGPSQLANVVLNTASNRTIRQDTALTIQVPGLDVLQGQIELQRLGSQLSQAAVTARLGH